VVAAALYLLVFLVRLRSSAYVFLRAVVWVSSGRGVVSGMAASLGLFYELSVNSYM
jgi:hypothetical protein